MNAPSDKVDLERDERVPGTDLSDAQTARLAALGFMLAGVCHELANPLTAINSMVQLLRASENVSPEMIERGLANIESNVRRMLAITRKLNDFSRVNPEAPERMRADEPVIEALQSVAQQPLFRGIEIHHVPDPGLQVLGVRSQLIQVYANVLLNAAQAMNGSGRLYIDTRRALAYVEVSIRDTGPGIAPGHIARLFQPFFTTKSPGEGTGLGLALSNEIVLEHGGSIAAENHADGGARFIVRLPLQ